MADIQTIEFRGSDVVVSAPKPLYIAVVRDGRTGELHIGEVRLQDATSEQVVTDILDGRHSHRWPDGRSDRVEHVYRVRLDDAADVEIADLLSHHSFATMETPPQDVRDYIEAYGGVFYEDAEYRAGRETYDREMARAS